MSELPSILIVDDTKNNLDILISLLSDKYEITVAIDGLTALDIISQNDIDLILLDIMMPQIDGYEVCEIVKANHSTQDIPIIFITAFNDEDSIDKAYQIGGSDYITKPFKPRELLNRVKTQIDMHKLITDLKYFASHDTLTNTLNRRAFFELGEKKFIKDKEKLFVIMIDIDKFKKINDTYGHHIGDQVIKLITKTISYLITEECTFVRFGGEEFGLLCLENNINSMILIIERIRKEIEELEIITDNHQSIKFTISSGVVQYHKNANSLSDLLKEADKAMYQAKEEGRNKSIFR